MLIWKKIVVLVAAALLLAGVFVLAACSQEPEPTPVAMTAEEAALEQATLPPIIIAALEGDDLLPFEVAETENVFDLRGLTVTINTYATVGEQHAAIANGQADALLTDMVDAALLYDRGTAVWVVTATRNLTAAESESSVAATPTATTLHQTLFETPVEFTTQRMLAFNVDFLYGNTAAGKTVSPEIAAQAVDVLLSALGQAVGQMDAATPGLEDYPMPDLPDREQNEELLRWLYNHQHISQEIGYDDLTFIPNAP